jgi:uncharacterized coiled-coil protein SlyX
MNKFSEEIAELELAVTEKTEEENLFAETMSALFEKLKKGGTNA